jgi:DNA ligase-1
VSRPYSERWERLRQIAGSAVLAPRLVPSDPAEAQAFYQEAVSEGYEGVMVKRLDSPYAPGVRGRLWVKVKAIESVDLLIVAADWGYGRRKGWLSNYHLAARDVDAGELLQVGKTFKGLTDDEFKEMTARLLELKVSEEGGTVRVRPQVVVEVVFNQLQRSRVYKSGLALRFARISRIRDDKGPAEIDTIQHLRDIYTRSTGGR